jgi:hypothetical protein
MAQIDEDPFGHTWLPPRDISLFVQINQDRDDLARRVNVNLTVLRIAPATNGCNCGTTR